MPTREELQAAEEKMNAAKAALMDYIEQPNRDAKTRNRLLGDLNTSIEKFMSLITERMKEQG